MVGRSNTAIWGLYFAGALGLFAGIYLVSTYNISTSYASTVPTATQTVKVCHNDCRYLAPAIAFRLYLGEGLVPVGGLMLTVAMHWAKSRDKAKR